MKITRSVLDFAEYIHDRQALAQQKAKGKAWPWSDDFVLNTYKFCHVYRERDACTQHLIKNIHEDPNPTLSFREKVMNIALFRRFNVRNFFSEIIYGPMRMKDDWKQIECVLDEHRRRGNKIFNEAYTICQVPFDDTYRPKCKHAQVLMAIKHDFKTAPTQWESLKDVRKAKELFQFLKRYLYGFGGFLAYQVLTDLTYKKLLKIDDLEDFCHIGPGALGGLTAIGLSVSNRDKGANLLADAQPEMFQKLASERAKYWRRVSVERLGRGDGYLKVSDIQNCLCEYRKYFKLTNGIKTRIRRYDHDLLATT